MPWLMYFETLLVIYSYIWLYCIKPLVKEVKPEKYNRKCQIYITIAAS